MKLVENWRQIYKGLVDDKKVQFYDPATLVWTNYSPEKYILPVGCADFLEWNGYKWRVKPEPKTHMIQAWRHESTHVVAFKDAREPPPNFSFYTFGPVFEWTEPEQ
jgi:hypothetical protein